jgi:hypothetical protein
MVAGGRWGSALRTTGKPRAAGALDLKPRLGWALAAAMLALGACAPPAPALDLTPAQWRRDLKVFAQELPRRHLNAFHRISRSAFDAAVADLDRRLLGLDGDQAFVGFQQIASLIGDGHTRFEIPTMQAAYLPIHVARFGDDYRVTEASKGHEALLGARVEAIDGVPMAEVERRMLTVTASDEGPGVREGLAQRRMTLGLYLHGLGISPSPDRAALALRADDGRSFGVDLAALPPGPEPAFVSAAAATPLMRRHKDDPLWCVDATPDVLYCDFRSYRGLHGPAAALRRRLVEHPPAKLVIDLRQNGGGDFEVGLRNLVEPIQRNPAVNRKGHLFVLIGPMTFSAAMSNSAHFRQRTQAVLVGEAIGERPNSFQENHHLTLPNSHLALSYSTRFYSFAPGDPTNEIRPDAPVATSWADYRAGRDPVLQWVIDQPRAP